MYILRLPKRMVHLSLLLLTLLLVGFVWKSKPRPDEYQIHLGFVLRYGDGHRETLHRPLTGEAFQIGEMVLGRDQVGDFKATPDGDGYYYATISLAKSSIKPEAQPIFEQLTKR